MLPDTGEDKTANVSLTCCFHCRNNFLLTQIRLLGKFWWKACFHSRWFCLLAQLHTLRWVKADGGNPTQTCFSPFFSFPSNRLSQIKEKKGKKKTRTTWSRRAAVQLFLVSISHASSTLVFRDGLPLWLGVRGVGECLEWDGDRHGWDRVRGLHLAVFSVTAWQEPLRFHLGVQKWTCKNHTLISLCPAVRGHNDKWQVSASGRH